MAVHASQSLMESLKQLAQSDLKDDPEYRAALRKLPHVQLIEHVRNMDLHGWPIPICDPGIQMMAMVSKPGHPLSLSSSNNVEISLQMKGVSPVIRRSPKDLKHGKVDLGKPVFFGCVDDKIVVHELATGKVHYLLDALKGFLDASKLIVDRLSPPKTNDPSE